MPEKLGEKITFPDGEAWIDRGRGRDASASASGVPPAVGAGEEIDESHQQPDRVDGIEDEGEGDIPGEESVREAYCANSEKNGKRGRKRNAGCGRLFTKEVAAALEEAGGSRVKAAKLLGVSVEAIRAKISRTKILREIYSNTLDIDDEATPGKNDIINRSKKDLQFVDEIDSQRKAEIVEMYEKSSSDLDDANLRELDISEKLIRRIRTLDKLAPTAGHFIAMGLEKTHKLLYAQLLDMHEISQNLAEKIKAGSYSDAESMYFAHRAYSELVKQGISGFKTMMEGGIAIARIHRGAGRNSGEGGPEEAKKMNPGWSGNRRESGE